ncbi:alpha-glucan family phosphorylase [Desulfovibrio oxyclinae]|uniref:alpha-glucan family phosphorylase n=1 Tax=Desulfovibrio oxyclinae TaxID=63560 RepID=UPI000370A7DD|nr:alpha-glucan family phosphorylase [Desulfovibrio oxyclinae]
MENSWLFEISWEVCNKVGGIHTVLNSKAGHASRLFEQRYAVIGPKLARNPGFEPGEPPDDLRPALKRLADRSIHVETGRWDAPGKPYALLVDFLQAVPDHDKLLFQLWNDFGVDSMTGGWDYVEPVIFSTAAAMIIKEFADDAADVSDVYAHFHEWMSGAGVLHLRKHAPAVCTLLTTHATMLGRAMSGSGNDIYANLDEIEPTQEAKVFGVAAKHSMESVSAREADCFTTVSNITRREAATLLGTDPNVVTVNGFNLDDFGAPEEVMTRKQRSRERLVEFTSHFLERDLDPEKTLFLATSGRYEFHNKGIDMLIESLGELNGRLQGQDVEVVTFILVSCGYAGFSDEARMRIKKGHYGMEKYAGIATHHIGSPEQDPIVNACRNAGLDNETDDRCSAIFIPVYLDGHDGVLDMEYYDALAGMDLTVFPSFYEPWGYTPMESASFAVPTVTSNRAGFGQWVLEKHPDGHPGVMVLDRLNQDYAGAKNQLTDFLDRFTHWDAKEHEQRCDAARELAEETTWDNFYPLYEEAYTCSAASRTERVAGVQRLAAAPSELISFSGVNTTQPRLRSFSVVTELPEALTRLRELADNLWWVWNKDAQALFRDIDPEHWDACESNPVRFLDTMDRDRLNGLTSDDAFMGRFHDIIARFDAYMAQKGDADVEGITWDNPVAYFSMEFGLHESIPVYSGGLGLLAGDHIKSASDLNLPFVGVSLLYKNGYFHQRINGYGDQVVEYRENEFAGMPVTPLHNVDDERILVTVDLPGRQVFAQIWEVRVGRASLYLLDTDVMENSRPDRDIAARLYEPSSKGRIEQEIILGIGGVRLLNALEIEPSIFHLNEGHSAFMLLERIRQLMVMEGMEFSEAKEAVRGATVFTMHTPVPAGNERFEKSLVENYFRNYAAGMGVPWDSLWNLGHMYAEESDHLNMTVLALRLSCRRNGVSRLHGEVSRKMWMDLWRGFLLGEVPIGHVTNGVHMPSWVDEDMRGAIERNCHVGLHDALRQHQDWNCLDAVEDRELWDIHCRLKERLYNKIRSSISNQWEREGEAPNRLRHFLRELNPGHLTICFARRFTAYKRPTLILHNMQTIKSILCNPDRPVNLIFAGKAHPADTVGASFINLIVRLAKQDDFMGRLIFLEGYDIRLARLLVSGSDLWLNTPTRLMEASGTSGMKAAANGVPNCSVLDGWWDEAYNGSNGWAVGQGIVYDTQVNQDIVDADHLYSVLEHEVVPEFYDRDEHGVPHAWVSRMRAAMKTSLGQYGTHRMVEDYIEELYKPALELSSRRSRDGYSLAREVGGWRKRIPGRFATASIKEVRVTGISGDIIRYGEPLHVTAQVDKGQLHDEELLAELVVADDSGSKPLDVAPMTIKHSEGNTLTFTAEYSPTTVGPVRYGVRILPVHPGLGSKYETRLIRWS